MLGDELIGRITVQSCRQSGLSVVYSELLDFDGDGFAGVPEAGDIRDCDDYDSSVRPGAPDACGDEVDQDCDGADALCGEE